MNANATNNVIDELPVYLCRRIEKAAEARGLSFGEAIDALVADFCVRSGVSHRADSFGAKGVSHREEA